MAGSPYAIAGWGLASAASWGAGDFSGGLAARRTNVFSVAVLGQVAGVVVMTLIALIRAEALPSIRVAAWACAAGAAGAAGILFLYQALAMGPMGIAAPTTAVLAASVPVVFGAVAEGVPRTVQLLGFCLAIAGVWFVSRPDPARGRPEGMGLAVLSGLAFGAFYILISQTRGDGVFWPLAAAKVTSFLSLLAVAAATGRARLAPAAVVPLILLSGVLDAGGNTFFLLAQHAGRLDEAAVLASLYPATTVILARLVLGERVTGIQAVGIMAVLSAIPLIVA